MKTKYKIVTTAFLAVFVFSMFSFFPIEVEAQSWTDISSINYTIQTGGNYRVTTDLIGSGYMIVIDANDVVLDGQGHTITSTNSDGIHFNWATNGFSNVEIYGFTFFECGSDAIDAQGDEPNSANLNFHDNVFIDNYGVDVWVSLDENITISDNVFLATSYGAGYTSYGIDTNQAYNVTIRNNTFSGLYYDIIGGSGNDPYNRLLTVIENNTFHAQDEGIYFAGGPATLSGSFVVRDNVFETNSSWQSTSWVTSIQANTGTTVQMYNNYFKTSVLPAVWDGGGTIEMNTTRQSGTRPHGIAGDMIGGNFYDNAGGTGQSVTGTDADNDGFLDSSYTPRANMVDYLPYSDEYIPPDPTPTPTPATTPTPTPYVSIPTTTVDFYYHQDTITTNDAAGYATRTTYPNDQETLVASVSGSASVTWGYRVYLQTTRGATELTDGTQAAQVSIEAEDGAEVILLVGSYTLPRTTLSFNKDALKFVLYSQWNGSGDWTARAVYITETLPYVLMLQSDAQFYLYADRVESGGLTNSTVYWGEAETLSGVRNLLFKTSTSTDYQDGYLRTNNFVMFLVAPYIVHLGNTFYAIILLAVCASVYIRYRALSMVVLLLILLMLVGGGFNAIVGDYVIMLIWVIAAFALGLVYWRIFR